MKEIKQYNAIIKKLNQRNFDPVYVLDGDEGFFLDAIADRLENEVLPEDQRAFNMQVLYGRDIKSRDLITACRRFPMMSEHQLIIVREAQFLTDIENLIEYVEQPTPTTVLALLLKGKKLSKATKMGKAMKAYTHFTSSKLRDYEVQPWLEAHLKTLGLKMDHQAMAVLIQNTGNDLHRIDGELQKIIANSGGRQNISLSDLETASGIDKKYNVFEFTRAIGQRNLFKSMEIAEVIGRDKKNTPFLMILPIVFNYLKRIQLVLETGSHNRDALVRKLGVNPFFVQEYVSASQRYHPSELRKAFSTIQEMDLRVKGVRQLHSSDYELLRELIVRIVA